MHTQQHAADAPSMAAPEPVNHAVLDLALVDTAAAKTAVTPTNEKAPDTPDVGGPVQTETQNLILRQPADDGKRFATLRAQLALAGGFTLLTLADGSFLVTRWNCCRSLADLLAVAAFVRQVGGAPHG